MILNIGKSQQGEDVLWEFADNSGILVIAAPRKGKTYMVAGWLAQIASILKRKILVVDYLNKEGKSEMYNLLRSSPVHNHFQWWIPRIKECYMPYFSFQEMDRFDFESLRFAEGGALALVKLIKLPLEWKGIKEAIFELPRDKYGLLAFNKNYNLKIKSPFPEATIRALHNRLESLDEVFGHQGESFDFSFLWRYYDCLTIQFFDIHAKISEANFLRAGLFFGKVLEQVWGETLYEKKPVFVVDESKTYCPANVPPDKRFKSLDRLENLMLLQKGRTGCMLILIAQDETHISQVMQDAYDWMVKFHHDDALGKRWFMLGNKNFWKDGIGKHILFSTHEVNYPKMD